MTNNTPQNSDTNSLASYSTEFCLAELLDTAIPEDFHLLSGPLPYRMLNDALFHIVFEVNPSILNSLLCALLNLTTEDISSIEVTNPFELGHSVYDKDYVLDLKIILNNHTLINIEVQVIRLEFWKERALGYLCRTYDELNKGDDYCAIKPAIQIGILDFELFKDDTEFFATYHLANDITHKFYSDKFRLSVLQLNQAEHATKDDIACKRVLWANFFKATTWEEVSMLAQQDPIFAEAAKTIYRVTADERVRNHCNAREMGERTYNTLVNQLDEKDNQLNEKDKQLDEKDKQLEYYKKLLKDHGIATE